jgi:hypothetical protein
MALKVIGAGVGRTGTHSLKIALERLLGGPCHHMVEVLADPRQVPTWIDAIEGRPVDWSAFLDSYESLVDWPGASFWPELLAANPDATVLLSVRDADLWYRSASNTIFIALRPEAWTMESAAQAPPEGEAWMTAIRKLLRDRFSDKLDDRTAMIDAYERHNEDVRSRVPADRLIEWTPSDGWGPICERLALAVPEEPFPVTNSTDEFRAMMGLPPVT